MNDNDLIAQLLTRVEELREALEQIERYSSEDHVKRRARAALSGGTNVPENEEGQCAEWPRCACGRGGPDLCAERGT